MQSSSCFLHQPKFFQNWVNLHMRCIWRSNISNLMNQNKIKILSGLVGSYKFNLCDIQNLSTPANNFFIEKQGYRKIKQTIQKSDRNAGNKYHLSKKMRQSNRYTSHVRRIQSINVLFPNVKRITYIIPTLIFIFWLTNVLCVRSNMH